MGEKKDINSTVYLSSDEQTDKHVHSNVSSHYSRPLSAEWLGRQPTCPVDRQRLVIHHLKPVPRILRNLLSRLDISCDNSKFGCQVIKTTDDVE